MATRFGDVGVDLPMRCRPANPAPHGLETFSHFAKSRINVKPAPGRHDKLDRTGGLMPQRVLITAGGSGIGRAIAGAFAANGAQVWVADIDKAALETCPDDWGRDALDVAD